MLRIKKMQADHVYLIRGASVANSPFFENEGDCKLFLKLVDRFLNSFITVNLFQNNRDGWAMIINTKSAEEIKRAYLERRAKSKKCKRAFQYNEVWRMLSDQVRIMLSTYVKATNQGRGRKGGKVRCSYERFVFESLVEAQAVRLQMESETYNQQQPAKRYRPSRKLHKISKKLLRSSPFLSCAPLDVEERMVEIGVRCFDLIGFASDVLRNLIKTTLHHHFPT